MVGLELAVGYLVAWAAGKARRAGHAIDSEVDRIMDAGLDRLHSVVAARLDGDPALRRLETEAGQNGQISERTHRRVQDALADATEGDSAFATALGAIVAELERSRAGLPGVAGIDLRSAQGVQVGNQNTQTNTFH